MVKATQIRKPITPFPQPAFTESAIRVTNPKVIFETVYNVNSNEFQIRTKTVSFHFPGKVRGKVIVMRASEVRLYSSLGISIKERSNVEFILDFWGGFSPRVGEGNNDFFTYGDALFSVDHATRLVEVWTKQFWFKFEGFLGILTPTPRPNVVLPLKGLPARIPRQEEQ